MTESCDLFIPQQSCIIENRPQFTEEEINSKGFLYFYSAALIKIKWQK